MPLGAKILQCLFGGSSPHLGQGPRGPQQSDRTKSVCPPAVHTAARKLPRPPFAVPCTCRLSRVPHRVRPHWSVIDPSTTPLCFGPTPYMSSGAAPSTTSDPRTGGRACKCTWRCTDSRQQRGGTEAHLQGTGQIHPVVVRPCPQLVHDGHGGGLTALLATVGVRGLRHAWVQHLETRERAAKAQWLEQGKGMRDFGRQTRNETWRKRNTCHYWRR